MTIMKLTREDDCPCLLEWLAYKAKCWQAAGYLDVTVEGLEEWLNYKREKDALETFPALVQAILDLTPNAWHDYVALSYQVLDVPRLEDMDLSQLLN